MLIAVYVLAIVNVLVAVHMLVAVLVVVLQECQAGMAEGLVGSAGANEARYAGCYSR